MAPEKQKKEIGRLVVVVLKAKSLPDQHTFSKQDPYAVVEVTNSTKEQTKEDKGGGQHPVWDEQFVIPVYEVEGEPVQKLKIQVFAKEPKKDPLLGEGEIIIHPQAAKQWENNQFDDWIELNDAGKYRGEVFLEMTWYPRQDLLPKPLPKPIGAQLRPNPPALQQDDFEDAKKLYPVAFNLQRRPSKLDPKTRLGRPTIVLGPTNEEAAEKKPLSPRGSSIQPWADQSVSHPALRNDSKPPARSGALPLPGEPEPLPLPASLLPASGQAAFLATRYPSAHHAHPPLQHQQSQPDPRYQQPAPRPETQAWHGGGQPSYQKQEPFPTSQFQAPAPSPHLPGAYPISGSGGYGAPAPVAQHYPAATTTYGTALYPSAPVSAPPQFSQSPSFYSLSASQQPRHRTPSFTAPPPPPPPPPRPGSVFDGTYVPRDAPPPPVPVLPPKSRSPPTPAPAPAPAPPPHRTASPRTAPSPRLSSDARRPLSPPLPPPASPSPPPPPSPPRVCIRTPSPVRREPTPPRREPTPPRREPTPPRREPTPPPVRKPLPESVKKVEPTIDARQASLYVQIQRERERQKEDARLAAELAAEYDVTEARDEAQRKEMERLSEQAAREFAENSASTWEAEKREREEADAKLARELALSEEA